MSQYTTKTNQHTKTRPDLKKLRALIEIGRYFAMPESEEVIVVKLPQDKKSKKIKK